MVERVYLIKDPYICEVMIASIIAHRLSSDPAWIVIVGSSGSGKTEFINCISACDAVHSLSAITTNTFISGQKNTGKETSLLLKIKDKDDLPRGIITFKDMTSLLSEKKENRDVIMGQLREIYDGKYSKGFGTGETIEWNGKITVIAGATHIIHTMRQEYAAMGERFLLYEMIQPDGKMAARKAMKNQEDGLMQEKRGALAAAFRKAIDEELEIPDDFPPMDEKIITEVIDLAEMTTRARSDVQRNWRSPKQEIINISPPEMPTRFSGALQAMAKALMVLGYNESGLVELLARHRPILVKLSLDSIPKNRRTTMQELSKYEVLETAGLAIKLNLPTSTVKIWIEDLVALGIAQREKGSGSKGDRWNILPEYKKLVQAFEGIKSEGKELTEADMELEAGPAEGADNSELKSMKLPDFE